MEGSSMNRAGCIYNPFILEFVEGDFCFLLTQVNHLSSEYVVLLCFQASKKQILQNIYLQFYPTENILSKKTTHIKKSGLYCKLLALGSD